MLPLTCRTVFPSQRVNAPSASSDGRPRSRPKPLCVAHPPQPATDPKSLHPLQSIRSAAFQLTLCQFASRPLKNNAMFRHSSGLKCATAVDSRGRLSGLTTLSLRYPNSDRWSVIPRTSRRWCRASTRRRHCCTSAGLEYTCGFWQRRGRCSAGATRRGRCATGCGALECGTRGEASGAPLHAMVLMIV